MGLSHFYPSQVSSHRSGKEKAHKHKQIFPVTAQAGGGGLPTGWGGVSRPVARGQKFMCCVWNPREHKRFRPGTRPGGIGFPAGRIGDRGDREIVYVPNVDVSFPAPNRSGKQQVMNPIDAHLPTVPSIIVFCTTAAALSIFLLFISFEAFRRLNCQHFTSSFLAIQGYVSSWRLPG